MGYIILKKGEIFQFTFSIMSALPMKKEMDVFKSLFKSSPITYFDCCRIYKDGRCFPIWSNLEWAEAFLSEGFSNPSFFCYQKSTRLLWSGITDLQNHDRQVNVAINDFSIDNGIVYVQKFHDCIDIYNFAARPDRPDALNFYLLNSEFLKSYIHSFQSLALRELKRLGVFKYLPLRPPSTESSQLKIDVQNSQARQSFELIMNDSLVSLSQRELQCIQCLANGSSLKQISQYFNVSPRTVETYIERIKNKSGFQSLSEICRFALKEKQIL